MTAIDLFSINGIKVKIHYSLFIILALFSYVFYIQEFPYGYKGIEHSALLSILTSISIFVAVLLHELGHSLVSKRLGYDVKEIILFIFGGLAVIEKQPKGISEAFISITGPAISLLISAIFYLLSITNYTPLSEFSSVFFRINLLIALFNLLPAFPLDGGRVLRALLSTRMDHAKATAISSEFGKSLAIFMGILGLFYNIWLTFIAIFIYLGASEEQKFTRIHSVLERFTIEDIMTKGVKYVNPEMKVGDFIQFVFENKHLGYPVVKDGRLVGIITLHDVTGKNPDDTIERYMKRDVITMSPKDPATKALEIMNAKGIGRIPVVEDDELVGIVSKTDIIRIMEISEVLRIG